MSVSTRSVALISKLGSDLDARLRMNPATADQIQALDDLDKEIEKDLRIEAFTFTPVSIASSYAAGTLLDFSEQDTAFKLAIFALSYFSSSIVETAVLRAAGVNVGEAFKEAVLRDFPEGESAGDKLKSLGDSYMDMFTTYNLKSDAAKAEFRAQLNETEIYVLDRILEKARQLSADSNYTLHSRLNKLAGLFAGYHGWKKNDSIGWGILWALGGADAFGLALSDNYGKRSI